MAQKLSKFSSACSRRETVKKSEKRSGQILILMAMLSTTLIILFGMVVGVGHLVQAKINLQNSVDLAAMSGASWQARFLNHISLINYRMRQNYKFVLYDMYVTQSRFNRGLQNAVQSAGSGGGLARISGTQTVFGICQQAYGYTPREGVDGGGNGVASDTDLCQNVDGINGRGRSIPPIIASPIVNLNPIVIAINAAILGLAQQVRDFCSSASGQNRNYFNYIMRHLEGRQAYQIQKLLEVLAAFDSAFGVEDEITGSSGGSGFEKIADQTIRETFFKNLISANKKGVRLQYLNPSKTRAFRNDGPDPASLSTSIFSSSPPQGSFVDYFERQRVRFSMYVADFGASCSTRVERVESPPPGTLLGLSRSRQNSGENSPVKIPFSIALRAEVKPNLLFWPRGLTPTLVAVGAAKPFGSRLGPPSELTNFETTGLRVSGENQSGAFANMSFYPGDAESPGAALLPGIGHVTVLRQLLGRLQLSGPNAGVNERRPSIQTTPSNLNCESPNPPFLCLALAPTLYESLFWNVFPFPPELYASNNPAIISEFPSDVDLTPAGDRFRYFMQDRMSLGFQTASESEIDKWHHTVTIGRNNVFRLNNRPVFFGDPLSVRSSWSPDFGFDASGLNPEDVNSGAAPRGRIGYQIKLVSLRQVCREIENGGTVTLDELAPYCNEDDLGIFL